MSFAGIMGQYFLIIAIYKTFEKTTKLRGKEHQRGKGWDWAGMATIHYYKGEFEDGLRCGKGMFTIPNKFEYVGDFKDDTQHGKGTIKYKNGDSWTGTWINGCRKI